MKEENFRINEAFQFFVLAFHLGVTQSVTHYKEYALCFNTLEGEFITTWRNSQASLLVAIIKPQVSFFFWYS